MQTFCSYCKSFGHNIRNCNHPTIDYNLNLIREKHATYYHNRRGSLLARALMTNYLYYSFNLHQIRSIVVRLRIGNASISKTNGIELICNHLNTQDRLMGIDMEDDHVTWSIDRTPDTILNNTNRIETTVSAHRPSITYNLVEDPWTAPNPNIGSLQSIAAITQTLIENNWIPAYRHVNYSHQLASQINPIKMNIVNYNNEKIYTTFDCPICLDCLDQENRVKLNCDHVFCGGCISELMKTNSHEITCALCRVKVTNFEVSSNSVCEKLKTHRGRIQVC